MHIGNLPKHLCHGTAGSSHFGTVVTLKQLDIALKEFTYFDTLYMSRSIKVILKKTKQRQQSKSVKLEFEFRALLEDTCCSMLQTGCFNSFLERETNWKNVQVYTNIRHWELISSLKSINPVQMGAVVIHGILHSLPSDIMKRVMELLVIGLMSQCGYRVQSRATEL